MTQYFTTPIFYVNDIPHIGHSYNTLVTDTVARFYRLTEGDENVFFLTGTDENSQKTVEAAQKNNQEIYEYLDQMAARWKDTWEEIGVSFDDFIRTTEDRHRETVCEVFQTIYDQGDIYKSTYEGLYCSGCETFKKSADLDENGHCPDHKKPPEVLSEENYFFRLSKYQEPLLQWFEDNPEWLSPASRKNEIVNFIKSGLEDISISRETAEFGISLPMEPSHKVYVWFDALINYYSAVKGTKNEHFWKEATHIVGKDITRFHCVIWPAMLMSAGISLPKQVRAHGFFTIDNTKMSKSLGNVVSPLDLSKKYGNDALRIGLLSSFEFGSDGDFSLAQFDSFYSSKLAGGVGNLFNRVIILLHKFEDGKKPSWKKLEVIDQKIEEAFGNFQIKKAIDAYLSVVDQANLRLSESEVWKLAKTDPEAARKVFAELMGDLHLLSHWAPVFLPETAPKMARMLGDDQQVNEAEILFPRLEER